MTDQEHDRGIMLEEYKDTFSLTRAYIGSDGQAKLQWCFRQDYDKEAKKSVPGKSVPVKITLGTKDEAIARLLSLLEMLGYVPDSVPF